MAVAKKKPLSFNTTLRNPERIAGFLKILCNYENIVLTDEVIIDICCDVIINKLYITNAMKADEELKRIYDSPVETFTREQAQYILNISPQKHKEAGFEYGWPSRFDTWYKLIMEFGMCFYKMNVPIEISPIGHRLVDAYSAEPADDTVIQNVFLNAMAKFQTSTPFRKNANNNVPLLLLLKVIKLLKDDPTQNNAGIFRKEIALFLCWPNNDANELYQYIKAFRNEVGFNYSDEIIYERCLRLCLPEGETNINKLKTYIKADKLFVESTDEYIRKMRITGVISLRGNGRFLDFNTFEMGKIEYLLNNYGECVEYNDQYEYYNFIKNIDEELFHVELPTATDLTSIKQRTLQRYAREYSEEKLISELQATYKGRTSDDLLKFIDAPAHLEFLSAIALVKYFDNITVIPNYPVDDEGLPSFTAHGGMADIECHQNDTYGLIEVSLMTGVANQTEHEMTSIADHLKNAQETSTEYTIAVFVAPILRDRALQYMRFVNDFDTPALRNENSGGIIATTIVDMIPKFKSVRTLRELV